MIETKDLIKFMRWVIIISNFKRYGYTEKEIEEYRQEIIKRLRNK